MDCYSSSSSSLALHCSLSSSSLSSSSSSQNAVPVSTGNSSSPFLSSSSSQQFTAAAEDISGASHSMRFPDFFPSVSTLVEDSSLQSFLTHATSLDFCTPVKIPPQIGFAKLEGIIDGTRIEMVLRTDFLFVGRGCEDTIKIQINPIDLRDYPKGKKPYFFDEIYECAPQVFRLGEYHKKSEFSDPESEEKETTTIGRNYATDSLIENLEREKNARFSKNDDNKEYCDSSGDYPLSSSLPASSSFLASSPSLSFPSSSSSNISSSTWSSCSYVTHLLIPNSCRSISRTHLVIRYDKTRGKWLLKCLSKKGMHVGTITNAKELEKYTNTQEKKEEKSSLTEPTRITEELKTDNVKIEENQEMINLKTTKQEKKTSVKKESSEEEKEDKEAKKGRSNKQNNLEKIEPYACFFLNECNVLQLCGGTVTLVWRQAVSAGGGNENVKENTASRHAEAKKESSSFRLQNSSNKKVKNDKKCIPEANVAIKNNDGSDTIETPCKKRKELTVFKANDISKNTMCTSTYPDENGSAKSRKVTAEIIDLSDG